MAIKLVNKKKDTLMPQSFDVFDEQTGAYDKRVRDVEPIGSTADYLNAYPVFTNYPNHEPLHLYKTEACMQSVAAIRKVCEENGVNLIVLTARCTPTITRTFTTRISRISTNLLPK